MITFDIEKSKKMGISYREEGGEFIQKNKMTSKLTGDIYLKIFPHEFLTFYKPDVIRDWKLNTILNG
jgi:hypothetical protein